MKKFLLLLSLLLFSLVCQADFNQGVAAYQQGDYATALKTWQKIAKQKPSKRVSANEIREAQYSLALLYWQGQGVVQDYHQTEKWLLLAANQGHSEAQSKLANLYLLGLTGQVNTEKARQWFEKSALQGNVNGQYNLGVLYLDGVGVPKDVMLAKKWLTAAAQQGDQGAKDLLAETNTTSNNTHAEQTSASVVNNSPEVSQTSLPVANNIEPVPPNLAAMANVDYYAIQLFASTNQAEVLQFIETWQAHLNPLLSFDKIKKSQQIFIVAYGNFSSTAEAKQVIADLPTELKKNHPWVIKMRGNNLAP